MLAPALRGLAPHANQPACQKETSTTGDTADAHRCSGGGGVGAVLKEGGLELIRAQSWESLTAGPWPPSSWSSLADATCKPTGTKRNAGQPVFSLPRRSLVTLQPQRPVLPVIPIKGL